MTLLASRTTVCLSVAPCDLLLTKAQGFLKLQRMVLKLRCSWSSLSPFGQIAWKLPCGSQAHVSLPHLNPSFYPLRHCFLKHIIPFIYEMSSLFSPFKQFFFQMKLRSVLFFYLFFPLRKAGPPSLKLLMSNSSSKIVRGSSFTFLKAIENGKRVRKTTFENYFFLLCMKVERKSTSLV